MDSGQRHEMLDKIKDAMVGAAATSIVIGGADSKAAPEPVTAVITVVTSVPTFRSRSTDYKRTGSL